MESQRSFSMFSGSESLFKVAVSSLWQTHHTAQWREPYFCEHFTIHSTVVKQDQMPYLTLICQNQETHKEKKISFSGSSYYLPTVTLTVTQQN